MYRLVVDGVGSSHGAFKVAMGCGGCGDNCHITPGEYIRSSLSSASEVVKYKFTYKSWMGGVEFNACDSEFDVRIVIKKGADVIRDCNTRGNGCQDSCGGKDLLRIPASQPTLADGEVYTIEIRAKNSQFGSFNVAFQADGDISTTIHKRFQSPGDGVPMKGLVMTRMGVEASQENMPGYPGLWGTVCGTGFTEREANVACREMGFAAGVLCENSNGQCEDGYAKNDLAIFYKNIRCQGHETKLSDCNADALTVKASDCPTDAAVVCFPKMVRLRKNMGNTACTYGFHWGQSRLNFIWSRYGCDAKFEAIIPDANDQNAQSNSRKSLRCSSADAGDRGGVVCSLDLASTCKTFTIGSSNSNEKEVSVDSGFMCPSEVRLKDRENNGIHANAPDTFVTDSNGPSRVVVKRTDTNTGWGMNLQLECCLRAEQECKDGVTMYQHQNYLGVQKKYTIGSYSSIDHNDAYTSLKVGSCCAVTVYEHGNFGGGAKAWGAGDHSFVGSDWNDKISSLRVASSCKTCFRTLRKKFRHLDYSGQGRTVTSTAKDCMYRCQMSPGCVGSSWWNDGGCHITNNKNNPLDGESVVTSYDCRSQSCKPTCTGGSCNSVTITDSEVKYTYNGDNVRHTINFNGKVAKVSGSYNTEKKYDKIVMNGETLTGVGSISNKETTSFEYSCDGSVGAGDEYSFSYVCKNVATAEAETEVSYKEGWEFEKRDGKSDAAVAVEEELSDSEDQESSESLEENGSNEEMKEQLEVAGNEVTEESYDYRLWVSIFTAALMVNIYMLWRRRRKGDEYHVLLQEEEAN